MEALKNALQGRNQSTSSQSGTNPTADSSSPGGEQLVFVYGTLKTGQPNNARLLKYMGKDISIVGRAVTKYPYPLVLATKYNVPLMINEICYTAKCVYGELFSVSPQALVFLDYIESAPTLYCRERIEVELLTASAVDEQRPENSSQDYVADNSEEFVESRWCWCYFLAYHNPRLVAPPFYSEYDSAKMPLRLDIESLTPESEDRIKRCIAREAQILPTK